MNDIRLVIWDLDETFWSGTLAEGSMKFLESHAEIVRQLARRGIVNSIVSKNDGAEARIALKRHDIMNMFVMPVINFKPKGPQISRIINTLGFRESAVLFIDDNPLNLAEAQHYNPLINVAGPESIAHLLDDHRLAGADDPGLTRLKHYRMIEKRERSRQDYSDNSEFLRQSDIVVRIDFDVEAHIDRAVEIINRTNQLNFTKKRLPEDAAEARDALRGFLSGRNVQAGLVHVRDRYGDHGYVGFYANLVHARRLEHFAFSCRMLGLGVERWLYDLLGRPNIAVAGEVAASLSAGPSVDWIRLADDAAQRPAGVRRGRILFRGGCELQSLSHYARLDFDDIVDETPIARNGRLIVLNHSAFIATSLQGMTDGQRDCAYRLDYADDDFASALLADEPLDAIVLSFWADALAAVYKHRETGLTIPFQMDGLSQPPFDNGRDIRSCLADLVDQNRGRGKLVDGLRAIAEEFDYCGSTLSHEGGREEAGRLRRTLTALLSQIGKRAPVYVVLAYEGRADSSKAPIDRLHHHRKLNEVTRAVAASFPDVMLIDPATLISDDDDLIDGTHFDRLVYFRMYRALKQHLDSKLPTAL